MEKERRALRVASLFARVLPLFVASTWGASALGANDEAARSIAQPLFDDGVKLMEEGHCDDQTIPPDRRPKCREALAKFKKAFDIYPAGLGALRNAAFCERGLGMFASATRDFREVARRAPLDPNPSKQLWAKHAADEADVLGKLVPHVTLTIDSPRDARVRLDGAEIPPAAIGVAIPVDPGDHVLEAEAPGHERLRKPFEIEAKEDLPIVVRLVPVPIAAPKLAPVEKRSYALPAALISVGVVGIGVGLGFGYAAKHSRDDACDGGSPLHCHDSAGLDRARGYALGSTIATAAGAALVVTGVVVILVSGPKHREVALVTSPGGAAIAGVF
ncbi:MAG: hypothetical protein ACXVEF_20500 [Polyangiales bacterium]